MKKLLFIRHLRKCQKRLVSTDPYVNKVRLLEYWNQSDHALESEYQHSQSILMVDKEPLVNISKNKLRLVRFDTNGKSRFF